MRRIGGHGVAGGLTDAVWLAAVLVGFRAGQTVDAGRLASGCIAAGDAGKAQHVIEGAILQHEYEYVLNR